MTDDELDTMFSATATITLYARNALAGFSVAGWYSLPECVVWEVDEDAYYYGWE